MIIYKVGDRVRLNDNYFERTGLLKPFACSIAPNNRYGKIKDVTINYMSPDTNFNPTVKYMIITDSGTEIDDVTPDLVDLMPITGYRQDIQKFNADLALTNFAIEPNLSSINNFIPTDVVRACADSIKNFCKKLRGEDLKMDKKIPEIDHVIFNDPATIILWKAWHYEEYTYFDPAAGVNITGRHKVQDKTVVKCAKGEKFNKYHGFCAAVTKYIFGTNSEVNRIVNEAKDDSKKVKEKDSKISKKKGLVKSKK